MPENVPYVVVGDLSAVDADAGDSFSYSIRPGGDGALFEIVGDRLRPERENGMRATIRRSDGNGFRASVGFETCHQIQRQERTVAGDRHQMGRIGVLRLQVEKTGQDAFERAGLARSQVGNET